MKDSSENQFQFPLGDPRRKPKRINYEPGSSFDIDDGNKISASPEAEAQAELVEHVATLLDKDKSLRTKVFRELHVKQRETLHGLAREGAAIENARPLAFLPELIDTSTAEAKAKGLETIKAEINGLHGEIDLNKSGARKLLANAVWYAKHIGDRLLFVKGRLLEHGEYEDWVEENFDGGISTARAYTRIAKLKNWTKIAPKLHKATLTLERALELLRDKPAEKEKDRRRQHLTGKMLTNFKRFINTCSVSDLVQAAHDPKVMAKIEEAVKGKSISDQCNEAVKRLRWRLLARQEALDSYKKQPDGNLKLRPLNELVCRNDTRKKGRIAPKALAH